MADATVTYGSYTFPTPSPFVAETTAPILLSGQSDYFMDQVSLIGNITGSDLSGLDLQKMQKGKFTVGRSQYQYLFQILI